MSSAGNGVGGQRERNDNGRHERENKTTIGFTTIFASQYADDSILQSLSVNFQKRERQDLFNL